MLKTFSIGGVHPHDNKLSAHQPIITAEVPAQAVILLGQHIGAPAKPVVAALPTLASKPVRWMVNSAP